MIERTVHLTTDGSVLDECAVLLAISARRLPSMNRLERVRRPRGQVALGELAATRALNLECELGYDVMSRKKQVAPVLMAAAGGG